MKKNKGKIKLIISNLNCTLLILNPQFGAQALGHTHCTLGKECFLKCQERSNLKFNLLQSGPFGFWFLYLGLNWP